MNIFNYSTLSSIRDIFLGRAYNLIDEDSDNGGPLCAKSMSDSYRFTVLFISVLIT